RLPRPEPATDTGHTAYRTAVNQWNTANEGRPYPSTVNAPTAAVNFVDEVEKLPINITHEQLRALFDAYLAGRDAQRKAGGSFD
ncbi:hypothetical protein H0H92_001408, partial [Tricholoma furcatifolium]